MYHATKYKHHNKKSGPTNKQGRHCFKVYAMRSIKIDAFA